MSVQEDGPSYLRVTTRCLEEDLEGTTAADVEAPVEEIENDLVGKFISMRSQDPRGSEKVQPLRNASEVYTLHAGEWRGATWHDREHDTVWLLAAGFHRSGKNDDAYPHFKSLDAAERLLPTEDDYVLLLSMQARSFVDDLMERAPSIMDEARRETPDEIRAFIGQVPISLAVVVDGAVEIVYLAVMMSGWTDDGPEPPADWISMLWAAFFPWVGDPVGEIGTETEIAGRAVKDGELIYSAIR